MEDFKKMYERALVEGEHLIKPEHLIAYFGGAVGATIEDMEEELSRIKARKNLRRLVTEGAVDFVLDAPNWFGCFGCASIEDIEKKLSELKAEAKKGLYRLVTEDAVHFALNEYACFGCSHPKSVEEFASGLEGRSIVLLDSNGPGDDPKKELAKLEEKRAKDTLSDGVLGLDTDSRDYGVCTISLVALMMRLKYTIGAKSVTYVSSCDSEPSEPVTI